MEIDSNAFENADNGDQEVQWLLAEARYRIANTPKRVVTPDQAIKGLLHLVVDIRDDPDEQRTADPPSIGKLLNRLDKEFLGIGSQPWSKIIRPLLKLVYAKDTFGYTIEQMIRMIWDRQDTELLAMLDDMVPRPAEPPEPAFRRSTITGKAFEALEDAGANDAPMPTRIEIDE